MLLWNLFNKFDIREGGKWSFDVHAPDKGNFVNEYKFVKIELPNVIAWKRFSKLLFQVVASFEEVSNIQTKIKWEMIC